MVHHSTVRYRGGVDEPTERQAANAGFRGGHGVVFCSTCIGKGDDEVKLNLTTRGTTQCNMRGDVPGQKGTAATPTSCRLKSFPSFCEVDRRLPRQEMPCCCGYPARSSSFKHTRIPCQLQGTPLELGSHTAARVVSTKERHTGGQKAATKHHVMDIRGHVIFSQHANSPRLGSIIYIAFEFHCTLNHPYRPHPEPTP